MEKRHCTITRSHKADTSQLGRKDKEAAKDKRRNYYQAFIEQTSLLTLFEAVHIMGAISANAEYG